MIHGIGVDLVEVDRFARTLERTPSIVGRLFTPAEQQRCRGQVDRLAARFAAKEAVAKALGTGVRGFAFVDVEVISDDLGRPGVVLHRGALDVAAGLAVVAIHLSLSTATATVAAYAIAER